MHRPLGYHCAYGLGLLLTTPLVGCGNRTGSPDADQPFGDSAIVVVMNPEVNEGNTVSVPASLADAREGLSVDVDPGGSAIIDATGLAVIDEVFSGEGHLLTMRGHVGIKVCDDWRLRFRQGVNQYGIRLALSQIVLHK